MLTMPHPYNRFNKKIFFIGSVLLLAAAFLVYRFAVFRKAVPQTVSIDITQDPMALGYTGQRKVVEDSEDNVFVGYRKDWNGSSEIFVAKVTQQGRKTVVTGTDKPIAPVGGQANQRVPSLAIDNHSALHVVWYGADPDGKEGDRQVKYTVSSDGGTSWSAWKSIAFVDGFDGEDLWQEHPSLFVDQSGTLYVVWEGRDSEHERQQIKLTTSTNGGETWSEWVNVRLNEKYTQSRPSLAQTQDGHLYLFMYSSLGNATQQVVYSTSTDQGKNWSDWQSLSDPAFDSRHVSVVTDSTGRMWAVWRSGKDKNNPINLFFSVLENGNWSKPAHVAASDAFQFFPSIGVDANGIAHVAWIETSDDSGFPREHPESGTIHSATFSSDQNAFIPDGQTQDGLYPNLPVSVSSDILPLAYLRAQGDKSFSVQLQWFKE